MSDSLEIFTFGCRAPSHSAPFNLKFFLGKSD